MFCAALAEGRGAVRAALVGSAHGGTDTRAVKRLAVCALAALALAAAPGAAHAATCSAGIFGPNGRSVPSPIAMLNGCSKLTVLRTA